MLLLFRSQRAEDRSLLLASSVTGLSFMSTDFWRLWNVPGVICCCLLLLLGIPPIFGLCLIAYWWKSESHSVVSDSLWSHRLYSPWNSPGQNTGVGSLSLFQGIFWTKGSNPGLLHCRQILYQLSHKGSSRILEWVAYPFSTGSSQPRNQTGVSLIAGRFFTNCATGEALTNHQRKANQQ